MLSGTQQDALVANFPEGIARGDESEGFHLMSDWMNP
jgi:hypothetical protein